MEPILRLNGVSKRFGGVVAADNITFDVYPGKIHGLIGPNGAGKSTLLNLISGIYEVDSGHIFFEDKEITNLPPFVRARMGIGRTFQVPRFMQRSSIRDNLLMGMDVNDKNGYWASFWGKHTGELEAELDEIMSLVDFDINWDDDISAISFGQRKILEIVRSLLSHSKVMLVDEPAAGLNRKEIENVTALLDYAAKKNNAGVILIEHAMDLVMSYCEEIVVINFGKMIAEGSPEVVSADQNVIEAYLGRDINNA